MDVEYHEMLLRNLTEHECQDHRNLTYKAAGHKTHR